MKRKLIINADDYGYAKEFNKGIVELINIGIVTSTSVMINRKYVKPQELKKFQEISIGLHLELKDEDTVTSIEKQIKKFKKTFSRTPSHLDGHKHCHITSVNLPVVIKTAKKYNLPVRSRFSEDRKVLERHKIKTPNYFISWHPKRKNKLFSTLKNVKAKIIELVCHPGYYDKKCASSYNKQREMELKILKSRGFKQMLKKFEPINYHEL